MNAVIESSFERIAMRADPPHQMNFPTDALSLIRKRNSVWKQWEIIRNPVFSVLMNSSDKFKLVFLMELENSLRTNLLIHVSTTNVY
jgi:hypothetical protein